MSDLEQDKFFAEGLDPLEVLRMLEASKKTEKANLHGANVAVSDVAMGAARVEACPKVRSDLPMTMP